MAEGWRVLEGGQPRVTEDGNLRLTEQYFPVVLFGSGRARPDSGASPLPRADIDAPADNRIAALAAELRFVRPAQEIRVHELEAESRVAAPTPEIRVHELARLAIDRIVRLAA